MASLDYDALAEQLRRIAGDGQELTGILRTHPEVQSGSAAWFDRLNHNIGFLEGAAAALEHRERDDG